MASDSSPKSASFTRVVFVKPLLIPLPPQPHLQILLVFLIRQLPQLHPGPPSNDKSKIKKTIEELDEKKKETLKVTWVKVNHDFGSIFSTLLPGTMAKLEPPEGCSFLDGLEVRVAFGGVWKQSLSELSGGQQSLLALSLILSLLLFKPTPLYILDEFIVISLKEGMFNNANVLFRTKFVDGVSTVQRTVASKPSRHQWLAISMVSLGGAKLAQISYTLEKTTEGTPAGITSVPAACLVLVPLLASTGYILTQHWLPVLIAMTTSGLLEAYTTQLDNAFIPLVFYSLLCFYKPSKRVLCITRELCFDNLLVLKLNVGKGVQLRSVLKKLVGRRILYHFYSMQVYGYVSSHKSGSHSSLTLVHGYHYSFSLRHWLQQPNWLPTLEATLALDEESVRRVGDDSVGGPSFSRQFRSFSCRMQVGFGSIISMSKSGFKSTAITTRVGFGSPQCKSKTVLTRVGFSQFYRSGQLFTALRADSAHETLLPVQEHSGTVQSV
ncbi:hypothetical protein F3Y22_tig00004620pilonHSYRG00013 [Hibiscus syriacus]|uniref:Uncharacterized protein n=1 Tax=Hibiscus syriacus TaxID=106335 RepID=A0A6A3CL31_HIBSY|nr:hypothetical protein F3Y22_tig00004620pilonHSYRG00013 [Hibiscus syriacus]